MIKVTHNMGNIGSGITATSNAFCYKDYENKRNPVIKINSSNPNSTTYFQFVSNSTGMALKFRKYFMFNMSYAGIGVTLRDNLTSKLLVEFYSENLLEQIEV